jgi:PIN domain
VTLVDTSAWIEFLQGTGSDTHRAVRHLLEYDTPVHTTDIVVMETWPGRVMTTTTKICDGYWRAASTCQSKGWRAMKPQRDCTACAGKLVVRSGH